VRPPPARGKIGCDGDNHHAKGPEAVDKAGILDDKVDQPAPQEEGNDESKVDGQELGDFHGGALLSIGKDANTDRSVGSVSVKGKGFVLKRAGCFHRAPSKLDPEPEVVPVFREIENQPVNADELPFEI